MIIINQDKDTVIANQAELASTFWRRFVGLLGRKKLREGEGLIIVPCSSIHTFFMRFPIDVLFLDEHLKVIKLMENVSPFRVSPYVFGAKYTVELRSGIIARSNTELEDRLKLNVPA